VNIKKSVISKYEKKNEKNQKQIFLNFGNSKFGLKKLKKTYLKNKLIDKQEYKKFSKMRKVEIIEKYLNLKNCKKKKFKNENFEKVEKKKRKKKNIEGEKENESKNDERKKKKRKKCKKNGIVDLIAKEFKSEDNLCCQSQDNVIVDEVADLFN
jgi:hypothetical protein